MVTRKWRKMAEIYKCFSYIDGGEYKDLASPEIKAIWVKYNADRDYSEEAMEEAFRKESFGDKFNIRRANGKINGYIEGKEKMDLTITEYWLPDLADGQILFAWDLYQDFPKWFLDRVLPQKYHKYGV